MGLELKKAKHATELKEAIQKRDAQELQESPPLPTPASLNCKHPSGGALGGGEGCDLDSVEAPGRAGDGKVPDSLLPPYSCSAPAFNKIS